MVLHLHPDHLQAIASHAERTYPEECCGLLLGTLERNDQADRRVVMQVWETSNAWNDEAAAAMRSLPNASPELPFTKGSRYWIDPKEMLAGQRYARDRQLDIIGIYHSHPDHLAEPSECDRVMAWSQYSYIIVSVQQGSAQDIRCWCLDDHHQFQAEEMQTAMPMNR